MKSPPEKVMLDQGIQVLKNGANKNSNSQTIYAHSSKLIGKVLV